MANERCKHLDKVAQRTSWHFVQLIGVSFYDGLSDHEIPRYRDYCTTIIKMGLHQHKMAVLVPNDTDAISATKSIFGQAN